MSSTGLVLVLDGPASVGRTTTAVALQAAWPDVRSGPLLDAGIDATMASFGPSARRWRELVLPHAPPRTGPSSGGHLVWGPLGRVVIDGMHRAAAAWAWAGLDVVVDHVLPDRTTAADLAAALSGLRVVHVGLVCDPDVLDEREREAGVHPPGTAVAQLHATRDVAARDLVLDTTEATTDELVTAILAEVARP